MVLLGRCLQNTDLAHIRNRYSDRPLLATFRQLI